MVHHDSCLRDFTQNASHGLGEVLPLFSHLCIFSSSPKKVAATKIDWLVPLVCHMLILNVYCNGYNYPSLAQGPEPLHPFITTEKSVLCIFD